MSDNLLLVPGLLCTRALFAPQMNEFEGRLNIEVADHTRHDSMDRIAADILESAPEKFALAGLSMGGYVAFEILRRAPERVTRLCLIDTSARADRPEQADQRRALIGLASKEGLNPVIDILLPLLIHPARMADAVLTHTIRDMMRDTGAEAFIRQQNAIIGRKDAREELSAIKCPTMIIVGEEDGLTPPKVAQEMAGRIPDADLEIVPDCGHLSTIEQPAAVNRIFAGWLGL